MPRQPEPELMDLDEEAAAYAVADFAEVNDRFVRRLLELVGPVESARAVDLGTGPGDIPIRMVRARPSWHVTAVDGSPAMLDLARRAVEGAGLSASIELVLGDAKALSLPPGGFDVVFSNSILHHINDVDPLWAGVRRLAKPGALVLLRDLARPSSREIAREIVERNSGDESDLLKEEFYRSLLAAYTPDEVREQLDRAGLSALDVEMVSDRHLDVFGRLP
ncbi:MAG: class I SAM-dependent methyltransferase [Phycisphaerae bacterium]|nr:class I SAM-dependent methyltransferase [Phycisphaerae bacterium]